MKAQVEEAAAAAAAAQADLSKALTERDAALASHDEEANRLRRIAKKNAEKLEELQVWQLTSGCSRLKYGHSCVQGNCSSCQTSV